MPAPPTAPGRPFPTARADLYQLVCRYARAFDAHDVDTLRGLFTPDAVMRRQVTGDDAVGPFTGRDDLVAMLSRSRLAQPEPRRHVVSTLVVHREDDATAATSTALLLLGTAGPRPEVLGSGRYEDEMVREPDGWRFRNRFLHLDLLAP